MGDVPTIDSPASARASEPEAEPAPEATAADGGSETGEHVAGLEVEPDGQGDAAPEAEVAPETGADGLITREVFFHGFCQAHAMCGLFVGSQALQGVPDMRESRPAADALYDTIKETPALHFLLSPHGKWMQRAAAWAAFAIPAYGGALGELRARRAARRKDQAGDQADQAEGEDQAQRHSGPVHPGDTD